MDEVEGTRQVLRELWGTTASTAPDLDEDCSPTRACRNMKDITFDGYAPEGTDMTAAWRERLRQEGKLAPSGASIRDLVLGTDSER
jgi:hypothetical protein